MLAEALNVNGRWIAEQDWGGGATHMALLRRGADSTIVLYWHDGGEARFWVHQQMDSAAIVVHVPDTGPQIFCSGHTVLSDGRLMVCGGTWKGETGTNRIVIFDPNTSTWTDRDTMRWDRWYPTATTLPDGDVLISSGLHYFSMPVFGGTNGSSYSHSVDQLALTEHAFWPTRPISGGLGDREDQTAVFSPNYADANPHPGYVMVFGGRRDGEALSDVWFATREDTDKGERWTWQLPDTLSTMTRPPARYQHAAAYWRPNAISTDDRLIIYGGLDQNGQPLSDLWQFRKISQKWRWEQITNATSDPTGGPGARYGHVMVSDPGIKGSDFEVPPHVLLHGGKSDTTGTLADGQAWVLWMTDPPRWRKTTEATNPPPQRAHHAATFENDRPGHLTERRMLLFGGEGLSGSTPMLLQDAWGLARGINGPEDTTYSWLALDDSTIVKPSARSRHSVIHNRDFGWLIATGGDSTLGSPTTGLTPTTWYLPLNDGSDDQKWAPLFTDSIPGNSGRAGHAAVNYYKRVNVRQSERFDPTKPSGQQVSALPDSDALKLDFWLYPHMNVLPSGNLFYSGYTMSTYVLNPDPQSGGYGWGSAISSTFNGGSSVMYRPGKVMKCGGEHASTASAYIEFGSDDSHGGWTTAWDETPIWHRTNHNLTMLPDGRVLATGGRATSDDGSTPRPRPQIWTPGPVPDWSDTLAAEPVPRGYHSTAMLLPDARIISSGGNGHHDMVDHFTIYEPPYLFNSQGAYATRPEIAAPDTIGWNETFTITSPQANNITKLSLIRPGAVTHGFNQDQRFLFLSYTKGGVPTRFAVSSPPNANQAPPGNYLLFGVDTTGVPSLGRWVHVREAEGVDTEDDFWPNRLDSLNASSVCNDDTKLHVVWKAPADDTVHVGATNIIAGWVPSGPAKIYEFRQSTSGPSSDTLGWFNGATVISGEPAPEAPTTVQSFEASGLTPYTWYWIGGRSIDDHSHAADPQLKKARPTYIDCGGGFGGGGGGGGGSSLRRSVGSFSLSAVQATAATAGHTLFEGGTIDQDGVDAIRLAPSPSNSATAWVRATSGAPLRIDEVKLVVVDHPTGTEAHLLGSSAIVGVRSPSTRIASASGLDVTARMVDEEGLYLTRGQWFEAEWPSAGGAEDVLIVEADRAQARGAADSSGILVQVPDAEGWRTVARVHPRNTTSEELAVVGNVERIRLVAESPVLVRAVSRLARSAESPTVQSVTPAVATLDTEGDATEAVAATGGGSVTVVSDALNLAFEPALVVGGLVRDQFLAVRGSRSSAAGATAWARSSGEADLPVRFALLQNRPNPFAGTTTIRFDLPAPARVKLQVFDAQGRRVASLADGNWEAGAHAVDWSRRDTRGRTVRPGIYVYRLEAGSFRAERKLVVLP